MPRATKQQRIEELGEENAELRDDRDYWESYARRLEGNLLRAYHRLQAYDRRYIAELEDRVRELEGRMEEP